MEQMIVLPKVEGINIIRHDVRYQGWFRSESNATVQVLDEVYDLVSSMNALSVSFNGENVSTLWFCDKDIIGGILTTRQRWNRCAGTRSLETLALSTRFWVTGR
jgi:hypothetical protein